VPFLPPDKEKREQIGLVVRNEKTATTQEGEQGESQGARGGIREKPSRPPPRRRSSWIGTRSRMARIFPLPMIQSEEMMQEVLYQSHKGLGGPSGWTINTYTDLD